MTHEITTSQHVKYPVHTEYADPSFTDTYHDVKLDSQRCPGHRTETDADFNFKCRVRRWELNEDASKPVLFMIAGIAHSCNFFNPMVKCMSIDDEFMASVSQVLCLRPSRARRQRVAAEYQIRNAPAGRLCRCDPANYGYCKEPRPGGSITWSRTAWAECSRCWSKSRYPRGEDPPCTGDTAPKASFCLRPRCPNRSDGASAKASNTNTACLLTCSRCCCPM